MSKRGYLENISSATPFKTKIINKVTKFSSPFNVVYRFVDGEGKKYWWNEVTYGKIRSTYGKNSNWDESKTHERVTDLCKTYATEEDH